MTARTTLAQLINVLRGMTEAGTADYTVGTATYWDGDQIQNVLDRHRMDVYREQLTMIPDYVGGATVQYLEFVSQYGNFEQTNAGTAIFWIEDGAGANRGTATYTVDYLNGKITFTADQKGTTLYLTGRSFDLYGAAADIWRHKAGNVSSTHFDFSTDNMRVNRSQVKEEYRNMANYYAGLARPMKVTLR
jgi:hypothetical protein